MSQKRVKRFIKKYIIMEKKGSRKITVGGGNLYKNNFDKYLSDKPNPVPLAS